MLLQVNSNPEVGISTRDVISMKEIKSDMALENEITLGTE